jgi:hypothetical protein
VTHTDFRIFSGMYRAMSPLTMRRNNDNKKKKAPRQLKDLSAEQLGQVSGGDYIPGVRGTGSGGGGYNYDS